jgi:hypothetical protein
MKHGWTNKHDLFIVKSFYAVWKKRHGDLISLLSFFKESRLKRHKNNEIGKSTIVSYSYKIS